MMIIVRCIFHNVILVHSEKNEKGLLSKVEKTGDKIPGSLLNENISNYI